MILLDTNVISAITMAKPDTILVAWLDRQAVRDVWTTAVTVFEVESGLAIMPQGQRKAALRDAWDILLGGGLAQRIAPFDRRAAEAAARLLGQRRSKGITVEIRDTQIAGIALAHSATLATRNTRHFQDLDTPVVNPWGVP